MDKAIEDSIVAALSSERDVVIAWVYGSVAAGKHRDDSDLDLALMGRHPFTAERLVELADKTGRVARREVDIVDMSTAHGTILEEVLTRGVRISCADKGLYEALTKRFIYEQADFMPLYQRLLRERRDRFLRG
jgi:uncharacterized protein